MTREEKARWLSEIYAAVVDGKSLQVKTIAHGWRNADRYGGYPDMNSNPDHWRIKPEPREFETTVFSYGGKSRVMVPRDWQPSTRVRVVEVLEDE